MQESKIRALDIADSFTAIHIDAIDEPNRRGKKALFEQILATHDLRPDEVLVVGDNEDSEIAAGNQLGMRTIQIVRPGVPRSGRAGLHIYGLTELKGFL